MLCVVLRLLRGGFDRPVFLRPERRDLFLALDDQPQRGALHAAGRQSAPHLLPQQRRQIETDEVVERASRLLRIHELLGQFARLVDRFLDRALRYFVEHHALNGFVAEHVVFFEHLVHVPRDGLALAVRVGREIDRGSFLRSFDDLVDVLLVLLDQLILHREAALGIHRAFLRHEIANVAVRRKHLEVATEVLFDRARFSGRFDDDEILGHGLGAAMQTQCSWVQQHRLKGC